MSIRHAVVAIDELHEQRVMFPTHHTGEGDLAMSELLSQAPSEPLKSASTPVYLTPAQVAGLLGVTAKTVLRWSLEDASMPAFRRGKIVRFERGRLLAWLSRQEPRSARRVTHGSRKDQVSAA